MDALNVQREISNCDFRTLVICSLRYSHGRNTYMPSEIIRIVRENIDGFSEDDLSLMKEEAEKSLEMYSEVLHDCDLYTWSNFISNLQTKIDELKSTN